MKRIACGLGLILTILASFASAQGGEVDSGDTSWILTATALVLMMTLPGLSLFYAGMVRQVNVLSIFMQCFIIACAITILWVIIGYSLTFGSSGLAIAGGSVIGNFENFLMGQVVEDTVSGSIPTSVFAMFQLTFAIITPALIIGGFAERMRFASMLLFSLFWSLLVYMPIAHWVWGGGWLGDLGFKDFAGGAVVHITAGVAAITAAIYMGNRKDFQEAMHIPHNLPFCAIGAGLLWVGWFGFNGGSALAANGDAGMALAATHISAATGAFTWMMAEWIRFGKPTLLGALTGMVAGLGTITPASGFVGPAGALVIGLLAGYICFEATNLIKRKLKIDDSLDVFSVHGVGGFLGCILTGIFASSALGVFSGQEDISIGSQLGTQAIGAFATLIWTAAVTLLILFVIDRILGLRVDEVEEAEGLDLEEHNERGYSW
ncbi:MAG: ammonium transporter [Gammaproteobacteria bacterium]|nr:ammonium transporter [Gammaproteobacteria bacterium]